MIVGIHPGGVDHLVALPHDGLLASAGGGSVRVWDTRTGHQVAESAEDYPGVNDLTVCGDLVAVATGGGLSWLDPRTGRAARRPDPVGPVAALCGGHTLLYAGLRAEPDVRCWDAVTGEAQGAIGAHAAPVLAVTSGGPLVFAGDGTGAIRRWDPAARIEIGKPMVHTDGVRNLATLRLPGGDVLLAAAGGPDVSRFGAFTGTPVGTPIRAHDRVLDVRALLVDLRPQLITAGDDELIRRWDARSGAPLGDPIPGRAFALFTHDGAPALAAGTADGVIVAGPLDRP